MLLAFYSRDVYYFLVNLIAPFIQMEKLCLFLATLVFISILFHGEMVTALRTKDGSEEWGYVQVRPSKPNTLQLCNFIYALCYTIEQFCCILSVSVHFISIFLSEEKESRGKQL